MKNKIIFSLIISCSMAISQQLYKVQTYSVKFSIKHALGATANGKFSNLVSSIYFEPSNLSLSHIEATVDANTFYTGNGSRDKHLKGKDYFDAEHFPKIVLKSTTFEKNANEFIGYFDVTIKGKTKNIKVPFSFTETESGAKFEGKFEINRLDFGVGGSSFALGDIATVSILLNTLKNE